ncbi:MAG: OmpA family protein [Bacteroidia bacterium]|nr:OmpA family protein [Bacteroidia bacterium]
MDSNPKATENKIEQHKIKPDKLQDVIVVEHIAELCSPYDDYEPAFRDDNSILFTSTRPGGVGGEDIWSSKRDPTTGKWSEPKNVSIFNTRENEGAPFVTSDGSRVYLTRDAGKERMCDIFYSDISGGKPTTPKPLPGPVNSTSWDAHPCVSPDGRYLVFSSLRSGGIGQHDIYICEKQGDTWSTPKNMGSTINTPFSELSPFITHDGSSYVLYFSSNGQKRADAYDIYRSFLIGSEWSPPEKLQFPVNTEADEKYFCITPSGEYGYFSSNRRGIAGTKDSKGAHDIYRVKMSYLKKDKMVSVVGQVNDAISNAGINAKVTITDITKNAISQTISADATGRFKTNLPVGRTYAIQVSKDGYIFTTDNFTIPENANDFTVPTIKLSKRSAGARGTLKNIVFMDPKSSQINVKASQKELDFLVNLLLDNPDLKVKIIGHVANDMSADLANKLSYERAAAVVNYLVRNNVNVSRLKAEGMGSKQPIADNNTPEGRKANQRIEFVIISED